MVQKIYSKIHPASCTNIPGSEFGNKNSFTKKSVRSEDNRLPQAETFLGFVKCFGEFVKGIYEICSCN